MVYRTCFRYQTKRSGLGTLSFLCQNWKRNNRILSVCVCFLDLWWHSNQKHINYKLIWNTKITRIKLFEECQASLVQKQRYQPCSAKTTILQTSQRFLSYHRVHTLSIYYCFIPIFLSVIVHLFITDNTN